MVFIKRVLLEVLLKHCFIDQSKSRKLRKNPSYAPYCLRPPALSRADVRPLLLVVPIPLFLAVVLAVDLAAGPALGLELPIRRRRAGGT